jgi:hypothetical protein
MPYIILRKIQLFRASEADSWPLVGALPKLPLWPRSALGQTRTLLTGWLIDGGVPRLALDGIDCSGPDLTEMVCGSGTEVSY